MGRPIIMILGWRSDIYSLTRKLYGEGRDHRGTDFITEYIKRGSPERIE